MAAMILSMMSLAGQVDPVQFFQRDDDAARDMHLVVEDEAEFEGADGRGLLWICLAVRLALPPYVYAPSSPTGLTVDDLSWS